jgi:hypothetical protein
MTTPTAADTTPTRTPDASCCPLCGQPNLCAMEQERLTGQPTSGPCWYTQATFSAELLASVPETARRKACICARCASQS